MARGTRLALVSVVAIVAGAAAVQVAQVRNATVDVQLLAFNDFHGALEPPSGASGRIAGADAGGMEYFAAHLARLKASNPNTLVVSGGDNIGGSPLLSSLFHDEATVEALSLAGLQFSALGNHDLDEGWWELYRMQRGGCHPVDGCQDGTPFAGASFSYLAANVTLDPRAADPRGLALAGVQGTEARPLLPGYAVRDVGGVRIGVIGLILQEAPSVILAASIRGLTFAPEAASANDAARALRQQGVQAIVVIMHEGGEQRGSDINGCEDMSRDLIELVESLSDDIDVVVSGHSHQAYTCTIDGKLVTSAASNGRLITDIDLRLRRSTGAVVAKTARNIIVTRDIAKDGAQSALLSHYAPLAEEIGRRPVGALRAPLTRTATEAGESALGSFIADALLETGRRAGGKVDVAFWNPGGIRADLTPAGPGSSVSYADLFAVLPFGNELIVKTLSGAALLDVLEQQFGENRVRIMQISEGFSYAYDLSRPPGRRVDRASVRINGIPLDPHRRYRVATSNFLWASGDGLTALGSGTDPVLVGVDVDLVADYLSRHSPFQPGPLNRIRRLP